MNRETLRSLGRQLIHVWSSLSRGRSRRSTSSADNQAEDFRASLTRTTCEWRPVSRVAVLLCEKATQMGPVKVLTQHTHTHIEKLL